MSMEGRKFHDNELTSETKLQWAPDHYLRPGFRKPLGLKAIKDSKWLRPLTYPNMKQVIFSQSLQ
jgi:hypothetical protein